MLDYTSTKPAFANFTGTGIPTINLYNFVLQYRKATSQVKRRNDLCSSISSEARSQKEPEIIHAWDNVFEYRRVRSDKQPPHYMALGTLPDGRTIELIAYSTGLDWVIFHAMTPPTPGFMHEYKQKG